MAAGDARAQEALDDAAAPDDYQATQYEDRGCRCDERKHNLRDSEDELI